MEERSLPADNNFMVSPLGAIGQQPCSSNNKANFKCLIGAFTNCIRLEMDCKGLNPINKCK
jgi:hypothetical protein